MIALLTLLTSLHAFELDLPRERDLIRARCEAAFAPALASKEEYEARVRVDCLHGLPGKEMKELEAAFVENCVATSNVRARGLVGRLEIDDGLVRTMFDYDYTPIFQKNCMDRELARFYRARAGERAAEPPAYSPRIGEVYGGAAR